MLRRLFSTSVNTIGSHATEPFFHSRNGVFTAEQMQQYEKDGFILVKKLLSQQEINLYTNRFLDIANGTVPKEPSMTMVRDIAVAKKRDKDGNRIMGDMAITKLQDYMYDEVLSTYPKLPQALQYAQQICGPNMRAMHTMLINKPPDVGTGSSRHPPHQDLWYFTFRPINRIVCLWSALQPISREVGGLFVLPGSHKLPLQKHDYPQDGVVNRAYFGIQHMAEEKYEEHMIHLEMEPGDTVIFHPLLVHGSSRNASKITRKVIFCEAWCIIIDCVHVFTVIYILLTICIWFLFSQIQ